MAWAAGGACGANIPISFKTNLPKLNDLGLNLAPLGKGFKLQNKDGSEYVYFKSQNGKSVPCVVSVPTDPTTHKQIPNSKPDEKCGAELKKLQDDNGGSYAKEFVLPTTDTPDNAKNAFIKIDDKGNIAIYQDDGNGKPDIHGQRLQLSDTSKQQGQSNQLNMTVMQQMQQNPLAAINATRNAKDAAGQSLAKTNCQSVEMAGTGDIAANAAGQFTSASSDPKDVPGGGSSTTQAVASRNAYNESISSQANTAQ